MKKAICLFVVVLLLMACASCTIPADFPKEGIYYCKELKVSIDFSIEDTRCAKLYFDDGTYEDIDCGMLGAGCYISRHSGDDEQIILNGDGKWKKKENVFTITAHNDRTVFVFEPVADEAEILARIGAEG